jgi:hypothetical protein
LPNIVKALDQPISMWMLTFVTLSPSKRTPISQKGILQYAMLTLERSLADEQRSQRANVRKKQIYAALWFVPSGTTRKLSACVIALLIVVIPKNVNVHVLDINLNIFNMPSLS